MSLRNRLGSNPVIYEVVPPKLGVQQSEIEKRLKSLEKVFYNYRIDAINVPELIERSEIGGKIFYNATTVSPEEYAYLIKSSYVKDVITNIISPRLPKDEFSFRIDNLYRKYGVKNVVIVGKERSSDSLPGYSVSQALDSIKLYNEAADHGYYGLLAGCITIFNRNKKSNHGYDTASKRLDEHERVAVKSSHGCKFVTSQINFDSKYPNKFLLDYDQHCKTTGERPITVFISLSTVTSPTMLNLLTKKLGVFIPKKLQKQLMHEDSATSMARFSIEKSSQVFNEISDCIKSYNIKVPIGLHIEQVGINNSDFSLELLDKTYETIKNL